MTLEELKQKIAEEETAALELLKQYNDRESYIKLLKVKAITEEFGVQVGSIIINRRNKTEFIVSRIETSIFSGCFYLHGRKKTKDGWSKGEQNVFHWTLKSESP